MAAKRGDTRLVHPDVILRGQAEHVQETARELCALVLGVVPQATLKGMPGWRLIGFRSPAYFCFVAPRADHVLLGFEHGVALPDPAGLLTGAGRRVRHVVVRSMRGLPRGAVAQLIDHAHQFANRPAGAAARPKAVRSGVR